MNRVIATSGVVMAIAVFVLSTQGCNKKWVQSDSESRSAGSASSKLPKISEGSSSGDLSGFSRNPSEERLAQDGYPTALNPSGNGPRQRAELTKEEKAAVEAGLHDVFFGYDQWTLSDEGMEALNHDAAYLKDHPGAVLKIEGHCDERGTGDYNMVLGDKRAKAARKYLTEVGVNSKQVVIVSYGKERPFCVDRDESCYQQNRRDHMLLSTR
ncbi:MAG: OmpA family protein [Nitrospira sp.]|nr:OmpA family protein [Nitrospira sp.]MDH4368200.1 OmpA family protein [Nitrospira sp.]MDH5348349.1 OmpA family protein [Nitrospira sp.]MDH5499247.1 OmpA family protein [Nitrospira sp.]MDH5723953.1 OmpA family protein [Nitrospira sp.]